MAATAALVADAGFPDICFCRSGVADPILLMGGGLAISCHIGTLTPWTMPRELACELSSDRDADDRL